MLRLVLPLVLVLLPCCATLVSDTSHPIQILTVPAGAHVSIVDEHGKTFHDGPAPRRPVTLRVMAGPFDGATYTIEVSAEGFDTEVRTLDTQLNPWTWYSLMFPIPILGHVLFDPTMGGRWTFRPSDLVQIIQLEPSPMQQG